MRRTLPKLVGKFFSENDWSWFDHVHEAEFIHSRLPPSLAKFPQLRQLKLGDYPEKKLDLSSFVYVTELSVAKPARAFEIGSVELPPNLKALHFTYSPAPELIHSLQKRYPKLRIFASTETAQQLISNPRW